MLILQIDIRGNCSSVGVFVTVAVSEHFPCAPLEGSVPLCRALGAQCWAGSLLPALGKGRAFLAGQVQRREVLILRYFEKPWLEIITMHFFPLFFIFLQV